MNIIIVLQVYGDECNLDPNALEEALALLSDTEWDNLSTEVVRGKRNALCKLLNIPAPKSGPAK